MSDEKKVMHIYGQDISEEGNNGKVHEKVDVDKLNENTENENDGKKSKLSPGMKELLSWVRVLVIAVAVALILNCFIIINSVVPSGSMESTIMSGSRMFGFRLAYMFDGPQQGDIVIFRYPDDESQTFVKRVIGTPGDTVEIKAGVTYVNGEILDEPYLNETPSALDFGPYVVPEDSYFVMGDNRNHSNDARYWTNTYVTRKQILAKAIICYWPLSDFGLLK